MSLAALKGNEAVTAVPIANGADTEARSANAGKASVEDFYSAAFGRLVGTWTIAEFNAFIAAPVDYVPGTKSETPLRSVEDAAARANLIAFLRQNSNDHPPSGTRLSRKGDWGVTLRRAQDEPLILSPANPRRSMGPRGT